MYASAHGSPATERGRGNANGGGLDENSRDCEMAQGRQNISSYPPRTLQRLDANAQIQQGPQHALKTGQDGSSAQVAVMIDNPPLADRPRQTHHRAPSQEASDGNVLYNECDLPDTLVNEPQASNHENVHQLPTNKMANRPLTATHLQRQGTPQSMTKKSRDKTRVSKSRPNSRTPEISNRSIGQPGVLKASTQSSTVDILQICMFMAHNEQEQSQAAKQQVREQQSNIEHLLKENLDLQRELCSVQGEKHQLGTELSRLKEKSESYKTHINDVTRSQKHLEKLILKSNEKQELLLKEIEEREDVARKQVEEAGVQIQDIRTSLTKRVEQTVRETQEQMGICRSPKSEW